MGPALILWGWLRPYRYWLGIGLGVVVFVAGAWLALHAWGNHRYDQGREDNERAWRAAEAKLQAQARKATAGANAGAATREAEHAAAVAKEKDRIDDAIRAGDSPLDVLFGNASGVCAGQAGSCKPSGSR